MGKREIRALSSYEIREKENDVVELEGYIAKFDSLTDLGYGIYEKISRGAFSETLADGHNIFLLYHHDFSKPLSSTRNNTLILEEDNIGLKFKATVNSNLSYGKDVVELVREGLVQGCSFGFSVLADEYVYNDENDTLTRTLTKVKLYEGSVLCIPQYEDTEVMARSRQIGEEERKRIKSIKENEIRKRKIALELELI
ncbi:HK97 family phage prohead protease [Clostridium tertium]|uniref:HK97 family phage prohead protease n=1 Tax=Clostridium tertium TaxID=1559 RepID=UPI0034A20BD4